MPPLSELSGNHCRYSSFGNESCPPALHYLLHSFLHVFTLWWLSCGSFVALLPFMFPVARFFHPGRLLLLIHLPSDLSSHHAGQELLSQTSFGLSLAANTVPKAATWEIVPPSLNLIFIILKDSNIFEIRGIYLCAHYITL